MLNNRVFSQSGFVLPLVLFTLSAVCTVVFAESPDVPLARTPPMGWNSFDSYGVYLHEKAALANINAMAEKLKPHGYEYFVVDNGWFGEYTLQPGTMFAAEKHAHDVRLNEYGYFVPSKCYFPGGFEPIVQRCRRLGLKFGVHLMRGIPRKAVELNLPIEGTSYRAADIANTDPSENCKWCQYCYGVDMTRPGAQAWYDGLIRHIAEMGVDFIKYDDIVPHPDEVEAVALAISKLDRPVVLSLSPGGKVDPGAIDAFRKANMLRVTSDVWDEQKYIDDCFEAWEKWQGKERPGFWIDMDMIPFGQLQLMSPPGELAKERGDAMAKGDIALAGKGTRRRCTLTKDQKRTFITMRAMAASPLMMGGDLPSLDEESLALITNRHMLQCNQNGVMGRLIYRENGIDVWSTPERGTTDRGWIGIFNRTDEPQEVRLRFSDLGLRSPDQLNTKMLWSGSSFMIGGRNRIPAHGVVFIQYESR